MPLQIAHTPTPTHPRVEVSTHFRRNSCPSEAAAQFLENAARPQNGVQAALSQPEQRVAPVRRVERAGVKNCPERHRRRSARGFGRSRPFVHAGLTKKSKDASRNSNCSQRDVKSRASSRRSRTGGESRVRWRTRRGGPARSGSREPVPRRAGGCVRRCCQGPRSAAGMTPTPSGRRYACGPVVMTAASSSLGPTRSRSHLRCRTSVSAADEAGRERGVGHLVHRCRSQGPQAVASGCPGRDLLDHPQTLESGPVGPDIFAAIPTPIVLPLLQHLALSLLGPELLSEPGLSVAVAAGPPGPCAQPSALRQREWGRALQCCTDECHRQAISPEMLHVVRQSTAFFSVNPLKLDMARFCISVRTTVLPDPLFPINTLQ